MSSSFLCGGLHIACSRVSGLHWCFAAPTLFALLAAGCFVEGTLDTIPACSHERKQQHQCSSCKRGCWHCAKQHTLVATPGVNISLASFPAVLCSTEPSGMSLAIEQIKGVDDFLKFAVNRCLEGHSHFTLESQGYFFISTDTTRRL